MSTKHISADAHHIRISGIDIEWRPEDGTCTFARLPAAMLWVDTTLAGMMSGVQAMVGTERFALALQCEGRKSVAADWQVISRYADFRDGFKALAALAGVGGWGRWELVSLDEELKEGRFRVFEGWEGRYQKTLGVCWGSGMLAGKLAGYCARLFETECWAEQTAFIARGDAYDEFLVRPSSRSIEMELEYLLAADEATRADMAVALHKLEREVAERTRAEESLRAAHEKRRELEFIINHSPAIAYLGKAKPDWPVEYVSDSIRPFGYTPDELYSGSVRFADVIHPEDLPRFIDELTQYHADLACETFQQEYRIMTRNGDVRWIDDRTWIRRDAQGEITHYQGIMLDITERKRMEETIRESEARYAVIFNTVHDALFIHDLNGRILDINQTLLDLFGITRSEALRMDILQDFTGPGNPEEELPDIWRRVLTGEMITFEWNAQRPNDGVCFPVEVWLQRIRLGTRDLILANVRDISERKRAEAERIELERQLMQMQKLESLGVLAGGIAHDFNNLLMIMLGNLDITLMDLPADSRARSRIEQAMQAARRATDLTRQMLAYAGKERFVVTRQKLNSVVRENLDLFKSAIPRTTTLDLALTNEVAFIEADAGQMQQVIMNLVSNAAEAIGENNGTIGITTGVQDYNQDLLKRSRLDVKPSPGRYAFIEVSDTGCGMDEQTLERLFEPFYTTKFMGRGMGMPAVLGIVRGHKGAILVESVVGRGTSVRVLLPVNELPFEAQAETPEGSLERRGRPDYSGKIMVVDDDDEVRGMCASLLARLGFEVVTAANAHEALLLFRDHGEGLIGVLLDLELPGLPGLDAVRAMQALRPDVPIILCSGYDEAEAARRFAGEGLTGFMRKPYSLMELQDVIARILKR